MIKKIIKHVKNKEELNLYPHHPKKIIKSTTLTQKERRIQLHKTLWGLPIEILPYSESYRTSCHGEFECYIHTYANINWMFLIHLLSTCPFQSSWCTMLLQQQETKQVRQNDSRSETTSRLEITKSSTEVTKQK
jgi:hypothetical protein